MQDENGVIGLIVKQRRHGSMKTCRICIAHNIDRIGMRPCGWHFFIELRQRFGREIGELAAQIEQIIDSNHTQPAAIGENGKTLTCKGLDTTECFGGGKHFRNIAHAQKSGPMKSCIIDGVRSCHCARMCGCGFGRIRMTSRFDHNDRFDPCGGTRGRHETARIADRFNIEKNGARLMIERKIIEQIVKIDIGHIADRYEPGKADATLMRP